MENTNNKDWVDESKTYTVLYFTGPVHAYTLHLDSTILRRRTLVTCSYNHSEVYSVYCVWFQSEYVTSLPAGSPSL